MSLGHVEEYESAIPDLAMETRFFRFFDHFERTDLLRHTAQDESHGRAYSGSNLRSDTEILETSPCNYLNISRILSSISYGRSVV